MSPPADGRAAVEGYFAAVNSDSFDDLAAVFAADVEIHTVGAEPVVGRDAALAHFPKVLSAYATHDDRVTRWVSGVDDAGGDAIVCDIAFTGTLADGRPVRFDALDVFDVRDGLIARVTTWYDTRLVARQVRG
ncbi:nuclear transport factor 2 family protein [Pseudonocardia sp. KRD291]|uniref:nuclear transport factor 2 family protein n=1 Tax=Pseudonocardia sp. KRD291 TaxID=2792007 RepID=UPI001C49E453|nr:nuclear transport factor 2 family protein [Pseudonocardia sp. KRD291]MBW0105037.1 nuclear transport factor 2 family protein [Pseudonocardia sp. KRD291]